MRINVIDALPADWRVTVTLKRSGGRDSRGNPLTPTAVSVEGCLFAPRATSDPIDRSDLTEDAAVLYMPVGTEVASTDAVEVPGHGTYAVDGSPKVWPTAGVEVPLRRDHG